MAESSHHHSLDEDDDDPTVGPSSSSSSTPLKLTIRFSTSLPDLPLTISSPSSTTVLALKRQVCSLRPIETQNRRLRFIHAGKVLSDTATLEHALRLALTPLPPPPPPSARSSTTSTSSQNEKGKGKGKGKAPMKVVQEDQIPIYIHCSIGDVLSAAELAQEAALLDESTQASRSQEHQHQQQQHQHQQSITAPRGFDRLLSAGFTQQEIASLRAQFLQLQSYTHTPDTMPTATELRLLEDRWLDDSTGGSGGGGLVGEGGGGWGEIGGTGIGPGSGLDDMLIGNVLGFFWPLGAVVWLLREEGVWSSRRQMAVFTGILVNFAFSVMRVTS